MPNRLSHATSPYLLQHRHNPVDWWPWDDDAFDEAQRRDVPVLLSVGYAACHWCHVMAHESFEDETTAAFLNEHFVSIKVDREERPDVDAVYMRAVQGLTGQGGWPMTVFLDQQRRPFHAGTYFPPEPRMGMPSFMQVLTAVTDAWDTKRDAIEEGAQQICAAIAGPAAAVNLANGAGLPDRLSEASELAIDQLAASYDSVNGGFGTAPKFPPSTVLEFLLRHSARRQDSLAMAMVEGTCSAMARGGMYDQLGGGFARYSVDAHWVVPHFEKMLYDNALLLRVYTHWFRSTGSPLAERISRETAQFLLRDLRTREGGFASALDADAPAEPGGNPHEGSSYVWTQPQLIDVLGEQSGREAAELLAVTSAGTFEDSASVLQLRADPADPKWWADVRKTLLAARSKRPQPARDDKVVAAWNGLAIAALADAGALFGLPDLISAATDAAALLAEVHLSRDDGFARLVRVSRDGIAGTHAPGVLEDYGDVSEGLLTLFSVTGDARWYRVAGELLETAMVRFVTPGGGFYDTPEDGEKLIMRPSDPVDQAAPSGWAATSQALLTYGTLMTSERHLQAAERSLEIADALGRRAPRFAGSLLATASAYIDGPHEIVIVGDAADVTRAELHDAALRSDRPGTVIAVGESEPVGTPGPFAGRYGVEGRSAAYLCIRSECLIPVTARSELEHLLREPGSQNPTRQ